MNNWYEGTGGDCPTVQTGGWKINTDHDIIIGDYRDSDIVAIGFDKSCLLTRDKNIRFPQVFKLLGICKSCSEAKRNGWDKEIPWGFNLIKYGHRLIAIFKLTNEMHTNPRFWDDKELYNGFDFLRVSDLKESASKCKR
jgi:hypothetical protein